MDALLEIERTHWRAGRTLIAGVDEAGRGPLAGPVVAAAVILPSQGAKLRRLRGLTDSKALSAKARAEFLPLIQRTALAYGVGVVPAATIDRINILQATFLAMRRAISCMERSHGLTCDGVLVDGKLRIAQWARDQWPIIDGDAKSLSIAAASVLAKELRDAVMVALDDRYPGYGLARHKGYPTPAHKAALAVLGPCPEHRLTFAGVDPRQGVLAFD